MKKGGIMTKILRITDRVDFKIGEVTFTCAPLNKDQKMEITSSFIEKGKDQKFNLAKAQQLYLKYSIKGISGVEDFHGNKYELSFDENGNLTDDCLSEILQIEQNPKLLTALWQNLNGYNEDLRDPVTNEKLEGVALELHKPREMSD